MITRWRAGSTERIDHALAAPLRHAVAELVVAASVPFGGIGSHFQRKAPERASKARTTPPGMSTRLLSSIADPTITMSSATAGGDVM